MILFKILQTKMLRFNDTLDARLAPNGKIDFKQFKNMKFAY